MVLLVLELRNTVLLVVRESQRNATVIAYNANVFINCPFDEAYTRFFEAIVLTVDFLGFHARSALELQNANETRISKIKRIISECKFGIHDLSRIELSKSGYPRFNMPFELGLDIGCREYGGERFIGKTALILDRKRYRYQKFISDISGQDPSIYSGRNELGFIRVVRDWLQPHHVGVPAGARTIFDAFKKFKRTESALRSKLRLDLDGGLSFLDYSAMVRTWLEENR